MTKEQHFFISLLADYAAQTASSLPKESVDWRVIAEAAKKQNLTGVIYIQCRHIKGLDPLVLKTLKEGFLSDVYVSVNNDYAFRDVVHAFSDKEIELLPFKGELLKRYYPQPELRTMGDRDILIHHRDRKCADEAMLALGYEKYVDNHAVWTYHKPLQMFEIHDVMFYENLTSQVDYINYFSSVWDSAVSIKEDGSDTYCRIPDNSLHFLYTMAHTAKHIINNGMGFRAFLDMVFFCQNAEKADGKAPDWDWIIQELKKLRLYDFTCNCFSLCEEWFHVKMPFRNESLDPVFFQQVTEKMFRDGIFGKENEDNIGAHSAKEIRRSNTSYQTAARRLTLHKLFPPYRDMQLIPWYAWVDGKPWLLPAAWVYRWFYCMKYKRSDSKDLLLEPYQKKKKIEEREQYLEKWGL